MIGKNGNMAARCIWGEGLLLNPAFLENLL
jgi:hypothetical protein